MARSGLGHPRPRPGNPTPHDAVMRRYQAVMSALTVTSGSTTNVARTMLTVLIEVIVDRGVDGGKLSRSSCP